jgi:hypothetical protein
MTPEQMLDELRNEIRELGRIISSPIEPEHWKDRARNRLEVVTEQLRELRDSLEEVK